MTSRDRGCAARAALALGAGAALLAASPAWASKPCMGFEPERAFAGPQPFYLRLPADARLLCGLGREPALRAVVPAGPPQRFEAVRKCWDAGCFCEIPDAVGTGRGKTYALRDGAGTLVSLFDGWAAPGRGIPCPRGGPERAAAEVEEVRLVEVVRLEPWPDTPPFTCYAIPPGARLEPGRRLVWERAREASHLSYWPALVEVVAPGRATGTGAEAAPPAPPALVPYGASLSGACWRHGLVEFGPPGRPPALGAPPPDAGGPPPLYRWEIRTRDDRQVEGPHLGLVPRALAWADPDRGSPLRFGARYALVVTAIDAWGRESPPARVPFELTSTRER